MFGFSPFATTAFSDILETNRANQNVTGVEATCSLGSVTVAAEVNITLTDVEATGQVGTVDARCYYQCHRSRRRSSR
jgi:hypothetical protein